jgi:AraC-like DNA-binding protein
MVIDPLSDMLSLVNAQSAITAGLIAGGSWALRIRPPRELKFYAVIKGSCFMVYPRASPFRVEMGDVVLCTGVPQIVLASDLTIEPVEATAVLHDAADGYAIVGDVEEVVLLFGHVSLDPIRGRLLLDVLPPIIHVSGESPEAIVVKQMLAQLDAEVRADRVGAGLASKILTQLMFIQLLRAHLAGPNRALLHPGWLRAIADEEIAPALHSMHGDPGRPWQLDDLAKAARMSRTTFVLRFKTAAGVAPLRYLSILRMLLAARALREENTSVSAIALSLGYSSESAFSNAFKRETGLAPKRYRTSIK